MATWEEQFLACKEEKSVQCSVDDDGVQITDLSVDDDDEEPFDNFEAILKAQPVAYQETDWIPILSIDPGSANCGIVFAEYRFLVDKKIVELKIDKNNMHTVRLLADAKKIDIPEMARTFKKHLYAFYKPDKLNNGVALIEKQYIPAAQVAIKQGTYHATISLQVLMATIYCVLQDKFNVAIVELINSSHYKAELGVNMGNHTANKNAAVNFAQNLVPFKIPDNHCADCVNQIYWWLQNSLTETLSNPEDFKIVIVVADKSQ